MTKKSEIIRVAVVDDDEAFRTALANLLTATGFTPELHASVAAFIKNNGAQRAHCLILDVMMPDIDGFALQSCLRRTNYEIPIIFCSGLPSDEAKAAALANGAVSFLTKPVKGKALIKAIHAALPHLTAGASVPTALAGD